MVLKNFRTLFLLATCWRDGENSSVFEIGHYIYFKDMRGNIQDASADGARVSFDTELHDPYNSRVFYFLYPSVLNNPTSTEQLRQIKDYDNLEDMIKSVDFWIHGTREHFHDEVVSGTGMIILGSGDTPPTPDDYCLDSWIPTTELSVQNYGCFCFTGQTNLNEYIGGFQATFKNMTNENKTVKEIGLIKDIYDNSQGGNFRSQRTKVLLVRNVLDNPIIVKPNELYTFNLILR